MTQKKPLSAGPGADLLPLFPEHSSVSAEGELMIGGVGVTELAERFGTPAYIVDEAGLADQARRFGDGLAARRPDSEVVFASKSFPCVAAYKVMAACGLSVDVAGAGELVMALAAGVPADRMYLHGNAKTTAELTMALAAGVGTVVVDNFDDIDRLEHLAGGHLAGGPQRVLLRIIPGISPQTHESQSTGGEDSKFGLPPARPPRRSPGSGPVTGCAWTGCTCTSDRRSWTPSRSRGPSRRSPPSARSASTTSAAASGSGIPAATKRRRSASTSTPSPQRPARACPPGPGWSSSRAGAWSPGRAPRCTG